MSEVEQRSRSKFQWQASDSADAERALVIVPQIAGEETDARAPAAKLAETEGLARAISLDIVDSGIVPLKTRKPGSLFGKGKIDEIAGMVKADES